MYNTEIIILRKKDKLSHRLIRKQAIRCVYRSTREKRTSLKCILRTYSHLLRVLVLRARKSCPKPTWAKYLYSTYIQCSSINVRWKRVRSCLLHNEKKYNSRISPWKGSIVNTSIHARLGCLQNICAKEHLIVQSEWYFCNWQWALAEARQLTFIHKARYFHLAIKFL